LGTVRALPGKGGQDGSRLRVGGGRTRNNRERARR
jgi:hypothetical protein